MWFALASHNRIVLPGEAEGVHNDAFVLRLCGLRCYPQPELSWSQAYSGHPRTQVRYVQLSECMVRRRIASEKRGWTGGLRQCIRPCGVRTPGHDGFRHFAFSGTGSPQR